jgi:diadenosine tetraphosphate (Ap4A) HIT family hydrolase
LRELTSEEKEEMYDLVDKWSRKLHTIHNWVNLLLRDGLIGNWATEVQKSVNHLHFHLIPDCPIWGEAAGSDRKWYSDEEYLDLAKEIRIKFLWLE